MLWYWDCAINRKSYSRIGWADNHQIIQTMSLCLLACVFTNSDLVNYRRRQPFKDWYYTIQGNMYWRFDCTDHNWSNICCSTTLGNNHKTHNDGQPMCLCFVDRPHTISIKVSACVCVFVCGLCFLGCSQHNRFITISLQHGNQRTYRLKHWHTLVVVWCCPIQTRTYWTVKGTAIQGLIVCIQTYQLFEALTGLTIIVINHRSKPRSTKHTPSCVQTVCLKCRCVR